MLAGRVSAFDPARGWGTVAGADGREYGFHCTEIADGTRTVPIGSPVRFARRAGHLGRWEAAAVTADR
jgi:CspA family cold shock protein